jgi:hypothetical protein
MGTKSLGQEFHAEYGVAITNHLKVTDAARAHEIRHERERRIIRVSVPTRPCAFWPAGAVPPSNLSCCNKRGAHGSGPVWACFVLGFVSPRRPWCRLLSMWIYRPAVGSPLVHASR